MGTMFNKEWSKHSVSSMEVFEQMKSCRELIIANNHGSVLCAASGCRHRRVEYYGIYFTDVTSCIPKSFKPASKPGGGTVRL